MLGNLCVGGEGGRNNDLGKCRLNDLGKGFLVDYSREHKRQNGVGLCHF